MSKTRLFFSSVVFVVMAVPMTLAVLPFVAFKLYREVRHAQKFTMFEEDK